MPSPWKVSPSPSFSDSTSFLNERSIVASDGLGPNDYSAKALHARGQPQRDSREGNQDHQPDQVGDDEGQDALEDGAEADLLHHAFYNEDDHSHRRADSAPFHPPDECDDET